MFRKVRIRTIQINKKKFKKNKKHKKIYGKSIKVKKNYDKENMPYKMVKFSLKEKKGCFFIHDS